MNERIQQLAEQARQYATTRHPISKIVLAIDSYAFEQKFAKLIVKECMEQVYYTREDRIDDTISKNIKLRMAEHFGVEE